MQWPAREQLDVATGWMKKCVPCGDDGDRHDISIDDADGK